MELAESGEIDALRAIKRDRFFRSLLYRPLTERDLQEFGVKMEALNDTGHRIGDGVTDDFAEWEREEISKRRRPAGPPGSLRVEEDRMNAPHDMPAVVGTARPHESAHLHVAGEATYVDDIAEVGGTLQRRSACRRWRTGR